MEKLLTIAARLGLLVCVLLTFGFAFAPARVGAHLFPWDKADHFAAFFALMTAAIVAFPRVPIIWSVIALSALGGAIELIQGLPQVGRDCDVWDWMAENAAIAAVVGLVIASALRRWLAARAEADG